MKNDKKYLLLSLATVLAVLGMSLGVASFAQTVTPLNCSVAASSVGVNQPVTLTATGGDGLNYQWSGQNLNIPNSVGSQFTVSYPTAGTYPVTVTSAGETATCNVNVISLGSTSNQSTSLNAICSPATQNITFGQTATFSASGGNGSYVWSSPDLSITNPTGTGFSANFGSTGVKSVSVLSNGTSSTCTVNVLAAANTAPATPSLPNTGGGYGRQ